MTFQTAHEAAETSCRRHRRENGDVEVTALHFPALHDAFETISHDSGASAGHDSYFVPAHWVWHVFYSEQVLSSLDPEWRRDNFVLGEAGEVEELVRNRPELTPVHELLNDFFEDFSEERE